MKPILLVILLSVFSIFFCTAQDTIIKKSGEIILAKILEVIPVEIKYKMFDYQDGPTFSILKSDVSTIKYQNGIKEVFNEEPPKNTSTIYGSDMFINGQKDAVRNYRGYKGAGTGTLITSLLSPVFGLIPAIACAATPPKIYNLNFPNSELMKNPDYNRGYVFAARKIKSQKVWSNFGIGLGVNIVAYIIIASSQ